MTWQAREHAFKDISLLPSPQLYGLIR